MFLDEVSRKASGAASQSSELLDTAVMGLVDAVASVGTCVGSISGGGGRGSGGSGGFSPEALAALDAVKAAPPLLSLYRGCGRLGTRPLSAVQRLSDAFAATLLGEKGVGSGGSDLAASLAALTASYLMIQPSPLKKSLLNLLKNEKLYRRYNLFLLLCSSYLSFQTWE